MNAEFPASTGRAMLIDGDKVCSSANPPAGLWPVENVVIVQEFASGLEVISLHRSPESRDDLPAVLCIACHGCQLYIHSKGQCLFKLPSPRNISAETVPGVVINHGRGRRRGRAGAMPPWRRNRGERRVQISGRKPWNCHHLCKQALQKHVRITKYGVNMQIFVFA